MAWSEHIHIHIHNEDNAKVMAELEIIKNQNLQIMGKLQDLEAKVDAQTSQITDLQTAVDAEQAQIQSLLDSNAAVVAEQAATIADLREQIAAGATADQLSALADKIEANNNSIATARTDIEGTVAP